MLAYQLMLTVKLGLPLSKLLTNQKTEARSKAELQSEKFASPTLKVKKEVVIKEERFEDVVKVEVKEEREEVDCPRERVSSSESSNFNPVNGFCISHDNINPLHLSDFHE